MESATLETIVSQLAGEFQELAVDLDELEHRVVARMRQVSRAVFDQILQDKPKGYQGSRRPCECGQQQRFEGYRSKEVLTSLGPVTIRRAYYRCRHCGRTSRPYDQLSGLGDGQLSNRLGGAVSLLAVQVGFAEASRMVEQLLGIRVDDNTVGRTAEQAGREVIGRQEAAVAAFQAGGPFPEPMVQPRRLYVSLDGTTASTLDGYREAKCGAVYWDEDVEGRQLRYVARFESSDAFGWKLWELACRCGLRQADEEVVLGDGAEWIWKQVETYMPGAVQILDWYHASEHVWACANALYGEGTPQAKRWADEMLGTLWEGGGGALLDRLKRSAQPDGESAPLTQLMGYVDSQGQRMDYPRYRSRGYDVGSGPVEAACKRLVGGRLKQAGMRWTLAGADAILALRTLWYNREWDAFWQSKPLAA